MMRIEIVQSGAGCWTGRFIDGFSVEHEVRSFDREEVLQKLIRLIGYGLTYSGPHWVNGKAIEWSVDS